ncbi:hypothetical protein [Sphingosinicella sp. BN140058]|uniref:phage tail protein n=1 Tax=Sphingosinicella sp. BN140058 TaxID=1892855 RepID=UPI00101299A7|nr:hypothetical protein [Sphingosinicella sp. BN140058]QAY79329.1 hypothetical protein ETR14_24390 [Sphingosinicella sp. BN140058]
MPPVRQAPKTPAPAARAPTRKPVAANAPSTGAVLQARLGNAALQKLTVPRAAMPATRSGGSLFPAFSPSPDRRGAAPASTARKAGEAEAGQGKGRRKGKGAVPVDGKAAAEAAPAAEDKEANGPAIAMHVPEPPSKPSPATAKRIAGVKARAGGTAAAQGTLPPASEQVEDAQQAVTPPDAERIAAARAELIATVKAAPNPAIVKLCERIRQVIRDKRPPDEDALMEAKPEEAAKEAGSELNATVEGETKKVEANYGAMNDNPAPAPAVPGAPIPPQPAAAETPPINARAGVPDAVPADKVSLDKDAENARKQADQAGMNKPAAQLVQSGPIGEARSAQGELDQAAKEDPALVLAKQQEALAKADADMGSLQAQALAALTASRGGTVGKTAEGQRGMVGTEAEMRAKAGGEAKTIFDEAQSAVKGLLKDVSSNAMAKWEEAKNAHTRAFKADLKIVQDRIDERHSGAGGFVVGIWDAITGLPDWAIEAYDKAEKNFGDGVIAKLLEISQEVESIIAACQTIIDNARTRIAKIFKDLPPSLQTWAAQEQAGFEKKLDGLKTEVAAARDSFTKDLSQRASEAVDEVRTEISELRKKAGGLLGRIADAIRRFADDPAKFIIDGLLELLGISPPAFWAMVAKIKKVINDIVDDPMGFANNLLSGIGQGFSLFFDNFGSHLIRGFLTWLLGDLKDVQVPKDLSLKSIVTFFLQIMGITWPNIRKIIAKKIGEKNVALIEKVYSLVSLLMEKGPEGIFEMIKEKLNPQAIVDQVVQMAVEFMVTAIAKQVAARLLLLFNPAGAILQAIEAIYRVLKWVFQNAAKIFTLIETIVNGLADIVAGNVGGFAKAVERGLAMLIPPVLGFIADYFSLGDLPKMVAKQIKSFREWILGLIESAFDWLIAKGKALLAALGIGKKDKDKDKAEGGFDGQIGEVVHWNAEDESHELWIADTGGSVEVMMASADKGPVRSKLTKYENMAASLKGPNAKERKERVAGAVIEARKILASTLAAAQAAKAATKKEDPKPKEIEAKDDETESWEDLLWPQLQIIQIALHLIEIPKTIIPSGGGQASSVTAEPLTKKGSGGSRPRGKLRGWDHVLHIDHELLNAKTAQWGPAYWVAAHLVSEKLHGPGDPWNTTPMRKVDNKAMERQVESDAIARIGQDEVLYYASSVSYHSGPILEDFPSSITIEWGSLRFDRGSWVRGEAFTPFAATLHPPPLDPNFIPDINDIRRAGLVKRGVPLRFAMAMDTERDAGGAFKSELDFIDRMGNFYRGRGGAADTKLNEGIGSVLGLVGDKKLQFGK